MRRNIPRKWLITDEQIVESCRREPHSIDQLFMVRGISEKLSTNDARKVLEAIKKGLNLPPEEWPALPSKGRNEANVEVEVDALAALARMRAKENDIAFQALVSMSDLTEVARGYTESEVLKGWRYEIVGKDLLAFMEGRLEMHIEEGVLRVTNRE